VNKVKLLSLLLSQVHHPASNDSKLIVLEKRKDLSDHIPLGCIWFNN
jgi:hypothetical protein